MPPRLWRRDHNNTAKFLIDNDWGGTVTLIRSRISGNTAKYLILSGSNSDDPDNAELTVTATTISDNVAEVGIEHSSYEAVVTNSTLSGNEFGAAISLGLSSSSLTLTNSTLWNNQGIAVHSAGTGTVTMSSTLIQGGCDVSSRVSGGYNIETPLETCSLDRPTDLTNVSAEALRVGPLADNGGTTATHALLPGSVAIDRIPELNCVDTDGDPLTEDQRGEPRPAGTMCDVGAFEAQP